MIFKTYTLKAFWHLPDWSQAVVRHYLGIPAKQVFLVLSHLKAVKGVSMPLYLSKIEIIFDVCHSKRLQRNLADKVHFKRTNIHLRYP